MLTFAKKIHTMKFLSKTFLATILTALALNSNAQTNTGINAAEFEKSTTGVDSIQLLDVRTAGEYNTGHIKNSLQADWNDRKEFTRRISFIDKSKPVYVYCLSSGRSGAAAKEMALMGYQKVYVLDGGLNAWKAANKPVEGKTNEKQMSVNEFDASIKSSAVVLVDFGAVWCAPCKKMEPVLKSLQANNAGKFKFVKVDGGKDEAVLQQNNVTVLPVFIVFKNGKQVWRRDGIATEKELADAILL